MNNHIQTFEDRLRSIFQRKAAEFNQYAKEDPTTATVTAQIAGLYEDLVAALSH